MNRVSARVAASQSFTPKEVQLLDQIFSTLLRGGDAAVLSRSPEYANVYRKVIKMKDRVDQQKKLRLVEDSRRKGRS